MKFYLSLTDENGNLIDRFRVVAEEVTPEDEVWESAEYVGESFCEKELCNRILNEMKKAMKARKEGKE